jgi:hypothetical protein
MPALDFDKRKVSPFYIDFIAAVRAAKAGSKEPAK